MTKDKGQQEKELIKEFYWFLIDNEIIEQPYDMESFEEYLFDDFIVHLSLKELN